jgi:hypothetical protein
MVAQIIEAAECYPVVHVTPMPLTGDSPAGGVVYPKLAATR